MEEDTEFEEGLPGPPPDPSSVPSVVRVVGTMDIEASSEEHGVSKASEPDIRELREFLDESEDLEEKKIKKSKKSKRPGCKF